MGLSLITYHRYKTAFKTNKPLPQFVYRVKRPKVLLQEQPCAQYVTTCQRLLLKCVIKTNKQQTNFGKPSG